MQGTSQLTHNFLIHPPAFLTIPRKTRRYITVLLKNVNVARLSTHVRHHLWVYTSAHHLPIPPCTRSFHCHNVHGNHIWHICPLQMKYIVLEKFLSGFLFEIFVLFNLSPAVQIYYFIYSYPFRVVLVKFQN